eukprot:431801-Alexandrium_andersonii.AAC.1
MVLAGASFAAEQQTRCAADPAGAGPSAILRRGGRRQRRGDGRAANGARGGTGWRGSFCSSRGVGCDIGWAVPEH